MSTPANEMRTHNKGYPLRVEVCEYKVGKLIDSRYHHGGLVSTWWDAISIMPGMTHQDLRTALRARVSRHTRADCTEWPREGGIGTVGGNISIRWDGCVVEIHQENWSAIKLHMEVMRPLLTVWFMVHDGSRIQGTALMSKLPNTPTKCPRDRQSAFAVIGEPELSKDCPPPYDDKRHTGGLVASLSRLVGRKSVHAGKAKS